jgi:hypothetical protein
MITGQVPSAQGNRRVSISGRQRTTGNRGYGAPGNCCVDRAKALLLCRSSPGFRLQVLVEPIKIALVSVADKAGPREAVELARINDQLGRHIKTA